jgi:hypothetical protein
MNRVVIAPGPHRDRVTGARFVSLGDRVIALDMDRRAQSLADRLASPILRFTADVTDDAQKGRWPSSPHAGHPEIRQQRRHDRRPAGDDPARTPPDVVDRVVK